MKQRTTEAKPESTSPRLRPPTPRWTRWNRRQTPSPAPPWSENSSTRIVSPILDEIAALRPNLLIVGKHVSSRKEEPDSRLARNLFENAPCNTLLARFRIDS